MSTFHDDQIYVLGIREKRIEPHLVHLDFRTTCGDFGALYHTRPGLKRGTILLSGSDGGFDGPGEFYPELSQKLLTSGVASLRLDYRHPGNCVQCAIDTLLAIQYLDDEAIRDVALVGWSFGGAVALSAGSVARNVRGIAAMSTTDVAGCCVRRLQSRSILLIHGDADDISSVQVPVRIHAETAGPKHLIIYPKATHSLLEVADRLSNDLIRWLSQTLPTGNTTTINA